MKIISSVFAILILSQIMSCSDSKKETTQLSNGAIDLANMDTTVKPGDDFYKYANGSWLKNNPIPDEFSSFGSFHVLDELNNARLKDLFLEAVSVKDPKEKEVQMMADFYRAAMDTVKIEEKGAQDLKPYLDKINALSSADDIVKLVGSFHSMQVFSLFYFYASQDEKNSEMVIAQIMQSGLGLPDRDYYLTDDENVKPIQEKYKEYIKNLFVLLGNDEKKASEMANSVYNFEKQLATASMTMLERRNPNAQYNKMSIDELQKSSKNFKWELYFTEAGINYPGEINVNQPLFLKKVDAMLKSASVDVWKNYLTFSLLNSTASYLSSDFVYAEFAFYGTTLSGKVKIKERQKRVIGAANQYIGEIVGKVYVQKYFPASSREKMTQLVNNLKDSWRNHILNVDWMTDSTKKLAVEKLDAMNFKIGYPDKWHDYSSLVITSESFVANVLESGKFEFKKEMERINKPIDRTRWEMYPQTINAYFHPNMNEIVFPAAILQPPFFFPDADDAVNYGAIGAVIGHEMTHGFDDQGRLYNKKGNLADWWKPADSEKFTKKTEPLVDFFNQYKMLDSLHVDGAITLGENIADLGGISVSLDALKKVLKNNEEKIDGFTPIQRFFLSYAQVWRQNMRDEELRNRLKTDVHSPAESRVNGVVYQLADFYAAFQVQPGDKRFIDEKKRIKIW